MVDHSLTLSSLPKTWLFDLDGTIVKHNGYLVDGVDTPLVKTIDFIKTIPETDKLIILTSRSKQYSDITENFLKGSGIRYDEIIYDLPFGERILINDKKPSGLETSIAVNLIRDNGVDVSLNIDESL